MSCATALRARAGKTLRFCYDRLSSLLKTLEITDMDDFTPLHLARARALHQTSPRRPGALVRIAHLLQRSCKRVCSCLVRFSSAMALNELHSSFR